MRKALLSLILVVVALAVTAVVAVNYQRPIRTISAEDDSGTLLVYHHLPERLVVLDASIGRLLSQLGLRTRVVGASQEAREVFPQAELLGPARQAAPLSIVALRPGMVLLGRESLQLADELRSGGVNVWLSAPDSIEQLLSGIPRLGKLLNLEHAANELAEQLENHLFGWRQNSGVTRVPRVLVWLDEEFTAPGIETMEHDLLKLAGGSNVVQSKGYVQLTPEAGLLLDPEVIFAPPSLVQQLSQLLQQNANQSQPPTLPDETPWARVIALPANLADVTWETALSKVEWIGQQLAQELPEVR